ncbi:uncharacterized protein MELLADRAFT_103107 [Melampsora larici-populina 98AG31]|uniref:Uncharacterized protein n=1 Tax=Melampsora larici-populina (strain 98AG31 / pathotype 3-4-7) TaxID=747676 RepID=F4RAK4_MELLP|nr:uncharacterized protein MELLADRAFT_103107 [Melampsora larici-populina 98AG31]EGG10496.1 hypothetical protein MELLADRAFT_103107 [Melampsora larici-populina 98AG31]
MMRCRCSIAERGEGPRHHDTDQDLLHRVSQTRTARYYWLMRQIKISKRDMGYIVKPHNKYRRTPPLKKRKETTRTPAACAGITTGLYNVDRRGSQEDGPLMTSHQWNILNSQRYSRYCATEGSIHSPNESASYRRPSMPYSGNRGAVTGGSVCKRNKVPERRLVIGDKDIRGDLRSVGNEDWANSRQPSMTNERAATILRGGLERDADHSNYSFLSAPMILKELEGRRISSI